MMSDMICLYCHERLRYSPDIFNLFKKPEPVCVKCIAKLKRRDGRPSCLRCHNKTAEATEECDSCILLKNTFAHTPDKIYTILEYNTDVSQLLHRYKFVNDAAISEVIAALIDFDFTCYDVIVPIPVSKMRMKERTYNQTSLVLSQRRINYHDVLITNKVVRQSELTKAERLFSEQVFMLKEEYYNTIIDNSILIVDDVYTTGITVHQALQVLKVATSENIDVLTFSRS